jgi:zinc D-Ala-D-Ala carboxypeptidase
MDDFKEKKKKTLFSKIENVLVASLIAVAFFGLAAYAYNFYIEEVQKLNETITKTRIDLADSRLEIRSLKVSLAALEDQKNQLSESLQAERERNDSFSEQIKGAEEIVDKFRKLSSIDPEILKKYSKTYFLSEHYVPSSLSIINKKYLYQEDDPEQIHSEVEPYLTEMIEDAKKDGVDLYIGSAYRSFGIQTGLKSNYIVTYGYGTANDFSAEQGYSEHQLGTAVDFLTTGIGGTLEGFGETEAFEWLENNAYKYGFVLSYPESNEYYIYEPWHWRFVGEKLAGYLHENNIYFYEMDQRDIDEYLVYIFD